MATTVTSPDAAGSEKLQPSEPQESGNQAKKNVSNGPSHQDAADAPKKDSKKSEESVKKFDNVHYVEAPIPKTNPWNKGKTLTESGLIFYTYSYALLVIVFTFLCKIINDVIF